MWRDVVTRGCKPRLVRKPYAERGIAFRRAQKQRMVCRAMRVTDDVSQANRLADNLRKCSCFMCQNFTHEDGRLQTIKHDVSTRQQLMENVL